MPPEFIALETTRGEQTSLCNSGALNQKSNREPAMGLLTQDGGDPCSGECVVEMGAEGGCLLNFDLFQHAS